MGTVELSRRRGPLPLSDLEEYASHFADLAGGLDGIPDAELVGVLGFAVRRVSVSLAYLLRGWPPPAPEMSVDDLSARRRRSRVT